MATLTMLIDETELIDFQLFGIVSSISDSPQFIYQVNLNFETTFSRSKDLDVLIESQLFYFPVFEWENPKTGEYYNIIKNTAYTLNDTKNLGSLSEMFDVTPFLINQFRQYNYLLKVSSLEQESLPIFENNFIQVVRPLDIEKVKQINRLIF